MDEKNFNSIFVGVVVVMIGAIGTSSATAYIKNERQDVKIENLEKAQEKDREEMLDLIRESREDIKKILTNIQRGS